MPEPLQQSRDLDFLGLVAELHQLVGVRVRIDAGAVGHPLFVSAAGVLSHLLDLHPARERVSGGWPRVAFGVEAAGFSFTVSEGEVLSARAWTVPGNQDQVVRREIHVRLAGCAELLVTEDPEPGCRAG